MRETPSSEVSDPALHGNKGEEACRDGSLDLKTFLGYAGLTCFEASYYVGVFGAFLSEREPLSSLDSACLLLSIVLGMMISFALFMSRRGSGRFPSMSRQTAIIFLVTLLMLPLFVVRLAAMWQGDAVMPLVLLFGCMFGVASAFFYIAWQLISWNLSVRSFVRYLGVCSACSCVAFIMIEVTLDEEYQIALGAFLAVVSGFVFYDISGGRRSDFAIERDSVGGVFVVEKRIDIIYSIFQLVGGAAVVFLLVFYRRFFLLAPLLAAVFLSVFLYFARRRQTYAGKFLLAEIRAFVSLIVFALVMLAVPFELAKALGLCVIVASWIALWIFQGIFLERVLGYGPVSVYYVSFADFNQNAGFFLGVLAAVAGLVVLHDEALLLLIMLVAGSALVLGGALFPPIEEVLDVRRVADDLAAESSMDSGGIVDGSAEAGFDLASARSQDARSAAAVEADPTEQSSSIASLIGAKSDEFAALYKLSKREGQVLRLLARGSSAKFIGNQLGMSEHTARVHTYHIYEKMGIHSRQSLIDLFDESGQL